MAYCWAVVLPPLYTVATEPFSSFYMLNVVSLYLCSTISDVFGAGCADLAWYGNPANPNGALGNVTPWRIGDLVSGNLRYVMSLMPHPDAVISASTGLPVGLPEFVWAASRYGSRQYYAITQVAAFINLAELSVNPAFCSLVDQAMQAHSTIDAFEDEYYYLIAHQTPADVIEMGLPVVADIERVMHACVSYEDARRELVAFMTDHLLKVEPSRMSRLRLWRAYGP